MIDTQAIRSKILDLAMRGQLTKQLPEDGNAEELYQQILEEKQKLIKEGKIKKQKPLPEITDNETPFDIPDNWKWVRWGNVVNIVSARRVHQSDWKDSGVPFYRAREIAKLSEDGSVKNDLYISEALFAEFSKAGVPKENDLMVSAVGTLGRTYVVKASDRFYYKDASVLCFENYGKVNPYYLAYAMKSNMMRQQIESNSGGTTVDTLTMVRMIKYLLPLPPLAEQKRIVKKIDQAFSVLDTIDKLQAQYADNLTALKSKLIDAAIQGKLTEQLPEDGTAEELYQQIQEEKQNLIKEGKIKKQKPLPEITDDEIPFDIPANWKWVHLGELFEHNTGKALKTSDQNGQLLEYITTSNLYWDHFVLRDLKKMYFKESEIDKCTVKKGDLLICEGGDIGRSAIWPFENEMLIQNHIHRLRSYGNFICVRFYYFGMWLYKHTGRINGVGIGLQGLSSKRLHSLVVPLPPLAEQKRIVQKLEEILPLCEKLK